MSDSAKLYRFIGDHAQDLASGRLLDPGEDFIELTPEDLEDPHNVRLIEEGLLVETQTPLEHRPEQTPPAEAEGIPAPREEVDV